MDFTHLLKILAGYEGREEIKSAQRDLDVLKTKEQELGKTAIKTGQAEQEAAEKEKRRATFLFNTARAGEKLEHIDSTRTTQLQYINEALGKNAQLIGMSEVYTKDAIRTTNTYTNGQRILTQTISSSADGSKILNTQIKEMNKDALRGVGMQDQYVKALKRVMIVVPMWMIARAGIQLFLGTMRAGITQLIEFDRQLQKSKQVIHGYAGDTNTAIKILEERFRAFALEAGMGVEKITSAFYRFGTVGIAFRDAMEGAIASAKLAKATFSDVDTIARSLALVYRLMGDTMDKTLSPAQKMNQLAGMLYRLWKVNAFEAEEFARSLEHFTGVANVANFTIGEMASLLAAVSTAGARAGTGGRILSTSVMRMIENYEKLAPVLGIAIKDGEREFDILMKIIDVLTDLQQVSRPEAIEAVADIFGGARNVRIISGLLSVKDLLKENLQATKESAQAAEELNKAYLGVIDSLSGSADRIKELRKAIGELSIRAVAGGEDAKTAWQNFANFLENRVIPTTEFLKESFYLMSEAFPTGRWASDFNTRLKTLSDTMSALAAIQDKMRTEFEKLSPEEFTELRESAKFLTNEFYKQIGIIKSYPEGIQAAGSSMQELEFYTEFVRGIYSNLLQLSIQGLQISKERVETTKEEADKLAEVTVYRQKIYEMEKDISGLQEELKTIELEARGLQKVEILRKQAIKDVEDLVKLHAKIAKKEIEIEPIGFEETFKLLEDFAKGIEGITAEKVIKFFPGIINIREVKEYQEALKSIVAYLKEQITSSAELTIAEKEKINIQHILTLAKQNQVLSGRELVELEIELVKNSKNIYTEHEKNLKLYELEKELIEELNKKVQEYANQFRSATQQGIAELLKGEGIINDFFENLRNKITDVWAEALSKRLTEPLEGIFTGIGGIFASIEDPVLEGFNQGALITYNAIVKGFQDGARGIITGAPAAGGRGFVQPGLGGGFNIPGTLSFFGGGGYRPTGGYPGGYAPAGYADPTGRYRAGTGILNRIGGWGGLAQIGMGGMAGGWMGAGITALSLINPWLGLGAMLLGGLFGKKKRITESTWTPQEVEKMFPYFGAMIPPQPKLYPLGRQRAFGEGGIVVNIDVDVAEIKGTDAEVASEIADQIANKVSIVLTKKYSQDLIRGNLGQEVIF